MNGIDNLKLINFRSYSQVNISLNKKSCVFIGKNGSGKSNLLEAISLLSPGRGMRKAHQDNLQQINKDQWGCVFDMNINNENIKIGIGKNQSKKEISINGKKASQIELLDFIKVLWFTPDMMTVFSGSTSDKRNFFNRIFMNVDLMYIIYLSKYEKILQLRSFILKKHQNDDGILSVYEKEMAHLSVDIYLFRYVFIQKLNKITNNKLIKKIVLKSDISEFFANIDDFSITFDKKFAFKQREGVEKQIAEILKLNRRNDIVKTSFSVHKDLIDVFLINENNVINASTGEQKDIVLEILICTNIFNVFKQDNEIDLILNQNDNNISNVLYQALDGDSNKNIDFSNIPTQKRHNIFILDEIVAYFDNEKREKFLKKIQILIKIGVQVIASGTNEKYFDSINQNILLFDIVKNDCKSNIIEK